MIDRIAIDLHGAVGDSQHQLAHHDSFQAQVVAYQLGRGQDHPGEFDLADAERPAPTVSAHPTEEKADQLPQRIQAQTAGHHRVALEVAVEEPEILPDVELGLDLTLAVFAASLRNLGDAVEHQHRRQRQLRIAGAEQIAMATGKQVFVAVTAFLLGQEGHPGMKWLTRTRKQPPRQGLLVRVLLPGRFVRRTITQHRHAAIARMARARAKCRNSR